MKMGENPLSVPQIIPKEKLGKLQRSKTAAAVG